MKRWSWLFLVLLISGCSAGTATIETKKVTAEPAPVDMTSSLNKLSYAAGYKIGDLFQNQKLSIVPDAVLKGMYDARKNIRPPMTKAEMKMALRDPKTFLALDSDSLSEKLKKEGQAFLKINGERDAVVVLESGLQYSILREGTGRTPLANDIVKIHYKSRTLKGHVFDSTYDRGEPAEIYVLGVVPGMAEGLQMMKEGAKWELYVPNDLAYGNNGPMAGQTLIFDVELLEVLPPR